MRDSGYIMFAFVLGLVGCKGERPVLRLRGTGGDKAGERRHRIVSGSWKTAIVTTSTSFQVQKADRLQPEEALSFHRKAALSSFGIQVGVMLNTLFCLRPTILQFLREDLQTAIKTNMT